MPLSPSQALVQVIGAEKVGQAPVFTPKGRAEGLGIVEVGSDAGGRDEVPETSDVGPPNLRDGAQQHKPIVHTPRVVDPDTVTRPFEEHIETGLAQLDNHLVRWEVARSIIDHAPDDQYKVVTSDLPSDPRHLDLSSFIPWCEAEHDYDTHLSSVIDQLEYEAKSDPSPSPDSPIQKLIRSGLVRFAIDLTAWENGVKFKMANARLASSNELLRNYGSDCWIQFRISEPLLHLMQRSDQRYGAGNDMWKFLQRPFRFYHRVYRSALLKDECVWFFSSSMGGPRSIYVTDMINKQLPLELNRRMKISKFNSRLQLGLSTTTPSVVFKPEQIRRVPDICSTSLRISKELMSEIATKLKLSYVPCWPFYFLCAAISGAHKVTRANYLGQQYTWVLFDPVGLPSDILLQVWNNDRIESGPTIKFLKFQFSIPLYVASSKRWKNVQCDIVVPRMRIQIKRGKPNAEVVMTDGAAAIGWGAALGIKKALGLEHLPAAYQARILKSKGLWYLSRDLDIEGFWIEIRESQWKGEVRCRPDDAIAFNICNFSTRAKTGHVNRQSIPVIVSRNVPVSIFIDRQRESFRAILDLLTTTNPIELTQALEVHGRLLGLKAKRLTTATNSCVRKELDEFGAAWEKYSNRPYNVMEEIVELLKSGFSTRNNRVLDRLNIAGKYICDKMMNFKVEVGCSATVYVIPDPTGTLQEGEVFLRLSRFRDPNTLLPINILKGDCVVARSPCVLPTDVRKVNAVANPQLMCYEDVLVCSIQGDKSLLDYLSGGDYDGDVVIVIWDEAFTNNFINADDPEDFLPTEKYDNFFSDVVALAGTGKGASLPTMRVEDFLNLKAEHGSYEREFRRAQLVSLFQPVEYGRYSRMYQACEYLFGISNPLTMKLGYVYTKCLDAAKQGIVLKTEADQALRREFEEAVGDLARDVIPLPYWTSYVKDEGGREWNVGFKETENVYLPVKGSHVLEAIAYTAQEERKKFLSTLRDLHVECNDPSLSWPWYAFKAKVKATVKHAHALLEFIESNAEECYREYQEALADTGHISVFEPAGRVFWIGGQFDNAFEAVKHDRYSRMYLLGRGKVEYNVLRASALAAIAPELDFFPFHVAFNELCHLKATATELSYQAVSGVRNIGHCPRAFAPEFCQAMMTQKSLLPPENAA